MKRNGTIGRTWAEFNEGGGGARNDGARNDGMSFTRRTIYSRSTPIARYHEDAKGKLYVLATSTQYSVSTAAQLQQALRHVSVPFFRVPYIGISGGWSREPNDISHEAMLKANAEWLAAQFQKEVQSCTAAWRKREHWYWGDLEWRNNLEREWLRVVRFLKTTGVDWKPRISLPDVLDAVEADREAKQTAWWTPKAVAARERAKARKLALQAMGIEPKAA